MKVEVKGVKFEELNRRLKRAATASNTIAQPELHRVGEHLADSVRDEIKSHNFVDKGNLLDSVEVKDVSAKQVDIQQRSEGSYIVYGTAPKADAKYAPRELVEWGERKLGLTSHEAFALGVYILKQGILGHQSGQPHYPVGARGYGYPEYVVEEKETDYLQSAADKIGGLIVKYIEAG